VDKRFLEDCLARGMSLEAVGQRAGKHSSTVSYWLKKHDLTATGGSRHAPKGEIDHVHLSELVSQGMSIRRIADELGAGYSTIRYWLDKLGLETERMARRRESDAARRVGHRRAYMKCPAHGRTGLLQSSEGSGYRCEMQYRRCVGAAPASEAPACVRDWGRCGICGYEEHPAELHFHHLNPTMKEFSLGCEGQTRAISRTRAEAEKCVLLRANRQALVEAGVKRISAINR
jgi:transposase